MDWVLVVVGGSYVIIVEVWFMKDMDVFFGFDGIIYRSEKKENK